MNKEAYLKEIISTEDPDVSPAAKNFYFQHFPETMASPTAFRDGFRGETALSLGWTFGSGNKTGAFQPRLRSYGRLFTEEDVELFYSFRAGYHSLANFLVIPKPLNIWKGKSDSNDREGHGLCDYFDIFLALIRAYYLSQPLPPAAEGPILRERGWLDAHGAGARGWFAFLEHYCLQPLINRNGEVKDLFASPSQFATDDCPPVGTIHGFDFALPLCDKEGNDVSKAAGKERALNYAATALWFWEQRAALLCQRAAAREGATA